MGTLRCFRTENDDSPPKTPRWPQPPLDPGLASAIYQVDLEALHAAALRLERCSVLHRVITVVITSQWGVKTRSRRERRHLAHQMSEEGRRYLD